MRRTFTLALAMALSVFASTAHADPPATSSAEPSSAPPTSESARLYVGLGLLGGGAVVIPVGVARLNAHPPCDSCLFGNVEMASGYVLSFLGVGMSAAGLGLVASAVHPNAPQVVVALGSVAVRGRF